MTGYCKPNPYKTPDIGRVLVDIYVKTACDGVTCITPVYIHKEDFKNDVYKFIQRYNATLSDAARKYRIVEVYKVIPHWNYLVSPLQEMVIWNEIDKLTEEHQLRKDNRRLVRYILDIEKIVVHNLNLNLDG